jgi:predicted nucleic acid-binding protein
MALSALSKFDLVPIDAVVADSAAELAHNHKLAMADTLVYAVAKIANAELWTQDRHFENLNGVRYFRKG